MQKKLKGYGREIAAKFALRLFLVLIIVFNITPCSAQKYTFSHYDIEDGLIQSQVNNLCLDKEHRLWMATFGGACRFDGKEFISFTRQNGMPNNFVNSVFVDKDDNVWLGTLNGLAKRMKKKLIIYKLPDRLQNWNTRDIVQDGNGTIWAIISNRLFKVTSNTVQEQWVPDTTNSPITRLAVDQKGRLFVSVYRRGLYYFERGKWVMFVAYPAGDKSFFVSKILFDRTDSSKLYLQTYTAIYFVNNGQLKPYESKLTASIKAYLLSLAQDADNNFWIGTTNGAYYLKNHQLIHLSAKNGLTDNAVTDVYNDADNNLWFASQGNGVFKYEGSHFTMFDKTQGMPGSEVVMGITKDKAGDIVLGIDGGGLMRYDGKKLVSIDLPDNNPGLKRVESIYADSRGVLWIGTREGLWKYQNGIVKQVKELYDYGISDITEDEKGTIWVIARSSCFYEEGGQFKRLDKYSRFGSSLMALGADSVIIGTEDGVVLSVNKKIVPGFKINAVKTSDVFCMIKYRNMLVMGTDDRGIFILNRANGEVQNYTVKDGMNSNAVYSMAADNNGVIWAGTGRGTNRLLFDEKKGNFTVSGNGSSKSLILESNQNAAFFDGHKIWIGTTKGAVSYDVNSAKTYSKPPHIIIQSARLIPQAPSNNWANSTILTDGAKLSHSENHLAIWFLGVYLKDPNGVSYRYKLTGLDTAYSPLVKNNVVDYPSLPPGKYTFEVKAVAADGTVSENTASFSFSITPPFYQALWFRIGAIVFFILSGILIQNIRHRARVNRQRIIEATRREESLKIRQQTAEDFHDELGNKLTRITVLSEILDTKMDQAQGDQKKLLEQIKQNAASLYNGTKDILWALDPQSDNLFEILNHIKDFGSELFLDTAVEFEFNGIDESLNEVKLPLEYSRNIPMIFKELLNNILKHAHATHVVLNFDDMTQDAIHLTLRDNGHGFDQQQKHIGQGINNIMMRTKRIGGEITISSEKCKGTLVELQIKINNTIAN